MEIRRGVAQFYNTLREELDVLLEINRSTLESLLLGEVDVAGKTGGQPPSPQAALVALFESGNARLVRGTAEDLARFFSYFDPPSREPIAITIR